MLTKPFDLEEALKGAPVVDGAGNIITQLHLFDIESTEYSLVGVKQGYIAHFTREGLYRKGHISPLRDLYMVAESRVINGIECPMPRVVPPKYGESYYVPDIYTADYNNLYIWNWSEAAKRWLDRGLVFSNKKDAIKTAKAMLGITN